MKALDPQLGAPHASAGGATVGDLRAMDGAQALAVMMFRDSFEGAPGTARVAKVFADALGAKHGAQAYADWSALIHILVHDTRRPLMRHALTCTCVGADEAVVAQILILFAAGERADATLTLALLVPGLCLVTAAQAATRAGAALLAAAHHYDRLGPPATARHLH